MNQDLSYKYSFENGNFHREIDGKILESRNDLCFASYTSVDGVEIMGDERVEMWNDLATDVRTFSFYDEEVQPDSEILNFEVTAVSESFFTL